MFCGSYFGARYFARRYFAKFGAAALIVLSGFAGKMMVVYEDEED